MRFSLRRIRLNNGGYDCHGAYWGIGAPLYEAIHDDGTKIIDLIFRAGNREAAKLKVMGDYPAATFYR